MAEPKLMKSDDIRQDWREVLERLRRGETTVIEYYTKVIGRIVPEPTRNDLAPATNPYLRAVEAAFCEDWPLVAEILGAKTIFELDMYGHALAPLLGLVREIQIAKMDARSKRQSV
jgi:antitoxin (DNA-binding transcriptional repressor) of toxin-antitoxin stability system